MTNLKTIVKTVIIFSLFSLSFSIAAPTPGMPGMGGQPQQKPSSSAAREQKQQQQKMTPAERRQQLEQEASSAVSEIDTEYAKYVSLLNAGRIPDDANVRAGLKFITKTRRVVPILAKQHNAGTYYALAGWVYYFDNKPDRVEKQIASGIKDGQTGQNFIRSAVALSILDKDYNSVEHILAPTNKGGSEANSTSAKEPGMQMPQSSQSSENTLNIDVNNIKTNLLGKDFSSLKTGKDKVIINVLLWQIDEKELEHYAPPKPKEPNGPNEPNKTAEQQPPQPEPQPENFQPMPMTDLTAFSNLKKHFAKNPKVVFVGINFNEPSKTKNVENWLAKNSQPWQSAAPSDTIQNMVVSLLGEKPTRPMLVIAGPDMKIRYVGDVNGFLPGMINSKILATPSEFAEPNDPNAAKAAKAKAAAESNEQMKMLKPTEDANTIKAMPPISNNVQPQPSNNQGTSTQPSPQNNSNGEFTEGDYQAQKDLEYAKTLFQIANRMQYRAYAKPIGLCRDIIQKYPNTKYAEQARVLMRQVPERFRENYHITDAELGL